MTLWSGLVLALWKQALHCDFDRLAELATRHESVRWMLGLGAVEQRRFAVRTVTRNVQWLSADRLQHVNRLVAGAGLRLAGWEPGDPLQARCDSCVVETDVEYPTDYWLLRDALVARIAVAAALSDQAKVPGWRQERHWRKQVNQACQRLRMNYRKTKPRKKQVQQLLRTAGEVLRRVLATRQRLAAAGVPEELLGELDRLAGHGATMRR